MKTVLVILAILFSIDTFAETITKDGVQYSCKPETSCEEKLNKCQQEVSALKKKARKTAPPVVKEVVKVEEKVVVQTVTITERVQAPKNIVSLAVVRSQDGLSTKTGPAGTSVETDIESGVGLMYQRRIKNNIYLGGAVDTNGGANINIGVGF